MSFLGYLAAEKRWEGWEETNMKILTLRFYKEIHRVDPLPAGPLLIRAILTHTASNQLLE